MRRGAVRDAFSRRDEVRLHILCMRCQVLQRVVNKPSPVESSSISERSTPGSCLESDSFGNLTNEVARD
jgi:hypothetical protein